MGGEEQEPDGEAGYCHYALHRLKLLPHQLLSLPLRERAFVYASIDQQIANEKRAREKAEKRTGEKKGGC